MKQSLILFPVLLMMSLATLHAADLEFTKTLQLPECHSIGWVHARGKGGYQALPIGPFATFTGDKATVSWLVNAAFAADWQAFQRDGELKRAAGNATGR